MKKNSLRLLFLCLIALVVYQYPRLNIVTGFAAKSVCSCTFEAGRTLASIEQGDNDFSLVRYTRNTIDTLQKTATASIVGLQKRTAVYKEGLGCVLLPSGTNTLQDPLLKPNRIHEFSPLAYPMGDAAQQDTVFPEVAYRQLSKAVENAFDKEGAQEQRTRAVLVLYKDQLIAERYAPGFTSETKFLGWSMTKSITSAVLGILKKQGKVTLSQDHLFPEWESDERADITLGNLLQMNTGLAWEEDYNKVCDVTNMLFVDKDKAQTQLYKPLIGKPGQSWLYSSGVTNLLSGFIRHQFDNTQDYLDFWYQSLIDRIGMHSMTIETDLTGNYLGSSYGWATARDWAKFGLLYLHKGHWYGTQILEESWVDFSRTPTHNSNTYGGHFWLNIDGQAYPNAPHDLFSCNGYQGQYVFIIPSKEMVIVRFGLKEDPEFNVDTFLKEVLAAVEV
ncbi:MAG: serine hydrolase [Lutibacter sp.]|jgi:CubicO group peptidase (beta-lactamase class C family)|nr:serine hydrolase [Lutibacter sp.]